MGNQESLLCTLGVNKIWNKMYCLQNCRHKKWKPYIYQGFHTFQRAADGNRTRDLRTTNATLYRLSHSSLLSGKLRSRNHRMLIYHKGWYLVNLFFLFLQFWNFQETQEVSVNFLFFMFYATMKNTDKSGNMDNERKDIEDLWLKRQKRKQMSCVFWIRKRSPIKATVI